jgi:hypothetical protein
MFDQAKMYWRFVWGLNGFLKETVTLEQCRETIRQRLQNREYNLLLQVKRAIYENKTSPYLKLLELSGCEYGDLEKLVKSEGIEPALKKLAGEGVYISIEEFKGKKDITRGGKVFRFKERDFDNPRLSGHFEARSGGSRSAGTRTIYDFDYITASRVIYRVIMLEAYGLLDTPFALWWPIMPGAGPMIVLSYTKAGKIPVKWFSPVKAKGFRPSLKNRMGTSFIVYAGRFFGAKLPAPEYVLHDEAWKIAEWLADITKKQGGCGFSTYPSLAVRICQGAKERGINLSGVRFSLMGEPITEAKRREIISAGSTICPQYAFTEGGFVGLGCLHPVAPDDVHFCKDSLALIQQNRTVTHASTSVEAFLFSSLLPSAPKILLNVESGDWGRVENRKCGCKLEELGLTEHISNIRGFDKLTGEGMTFIGTDMVRIIEEVLPARFGGSPTDFQMVEEEDEKGHTRMSILVHPRLGVINEAELIGLIINELSKGKDTQRMMAQVWAQSAIFRVKRLPPSITAAGKLMPLHINKHK